MQWDYHKLLKKVNLRKTSSLLKALTVEPLISLSGNRDKITYVTSNTHYSQPCGDKVLLHSVENDWETFGSIDKA